jgi:hypothetical protein
MLLSDFAFWAREHAVMGLNPVGHVVCIITYSDANMLQKCYYRITKNVRQNTLSPAGFKHFASPKRD